MMSKYPHASYFLCHISRTLNWDNEKGESYFQNTAGEFQSFIVEQIDNQKNIDIGILKLVY